MACNDIPSLLDLQKAKLNADDFGRLMGTGTGTSTNGVTGQVRPTFNKVINEMQGEFNQQISDQESEFNQHIAGMGFTRFGTFAAGATLTNPRQTLLWDIADGGDGQEYGWSGVFPPSGKVVSPGSTPLTTGGIAVGAWISRFDPELLIQVREALRRSYAEAGYNLVDGSFEAGGTLVNANDVLLHERTGKAFSGPAGTVAAGTNPASGGFVDKSGGLLRHELATSDGAAKVGNANGGSVQDFIDGLAAPDSDVLVGGVAAGEITQRLADAEQRIIDLPDEVDAAGTAATLVSQHNNDAHAHPALSAFISSEADRAETAAESIKPYVDAALSDLSTAANKFYPTLAAANADIANIAVNQPVTVGESANGGLWYKATSGATSLTKSPYDPIQQGKKSFLNTFATFAQLEASSLDRYVFAAVVNDPDQSKNGYYQKNVNYEWYLVRLNSETMKADLQTTSLTINLTDLTATIPFGAFAYTANGRVAVPAQTVTGLSATGRRNFMLSKADRTVTAVTDSAANPLIVAKTHYLLFTYDAAKQAAIGYTGVLDIVGAPSLTAKPNYSLIFTKPSSLNFDFNNNRIVISENLWLAYDGTRLLITPTEIPLDPARNKGFRTLLLVNPSTSQIVLKSSAAGYSAPKDHVLIGAYQESDMLFFGLEHFSVNGEPFNSSAEKVKPVFGWDVNTKVEVDVADSFTPSDSVNLSNLTSSIVYSWFDALVSACPEYITKTLLGNDASGTLPIYQYRFNPKRVGTDGLLDTKIPKVMLMTQHNEGINFVYTYLLMREICNNWQNNEALESMRFGVEFVVIPVGNPWGLDNGNRKNSNSVDLNRNFPIGWMKLGTPSDTFYSGESALSEAEVQHIYNAMVAEKPDIFFDCHSYGSWNNNGRSVWQPVLNDKTRVAAMSTAQKVYAQYKKENAWLVDLDDLVYINDSTIAGGGLASKSAESVGAVGGTIEVSWNLKNEPTGETGHNSIINFATDYLGTSILQALSVIISSK